MPSVENSLYRLTHSEYYEVIDRYTPNPDPFLRAVQRIVGTNWKIIRDGVWFHCLHNTEEFPLQGWKIHVSTCQRDATEVLKAVARVLAEGTTNWKFALDLPTLELLNSKNWERGGAGKFITVYPKDTATFEALIEKIAQSTFRYEGPYVLSDRRYRASSVVYYRYGGMKPVTRLNVRGERVPVLVSPNGALVPDRREAQFVVPAWAKDPFPEETDTEGSSTVLLKNGRYLVEKALYFSNAGGVYLAKDQMADRTVLIKEARPHVQWDAEGSDSIGSLSREYRLLSKVAGMGIAPRPFDLFKDWEHAFLVEEFIEGTSLGEFSAIHTIIGRTRPRTEDFEHFCDTYKRIFAQLARNLLILHGAGITLGDLSPGNVIVGEDLRPWLIDFGGACEVGVDAPTSTFTPGYASDARVKARAGGFKEDCFSLGALMLTFLLPLNPLMIQKPDCKNEVLDMLVSCACLPQEIKGTILGLLSDDPEQRLSLESVLRVLENVAITARVPPVLAASSPDTRANDAIDGMISYILESATYDREDRLFPANWHVFTTNPLSIAYGASGVCWAIHRLGFELPTAAIDWILRHKITPDAYPPGLYLGLTGIAWVLLDLGLENEAVQLMDTASQHPLRDDSPDLLYGLAGWGLANLHFFLRLKSEVFLNRARTAGKLLASRSIESEAGLCWESMNEVQFGLGHGSSGISLFLLYLYLITRDEHFFEVGKRALDFDLSNGIPTDDGGISWPYNSRTPSPVLPYWRHGSTGVGVALLRYYRVLPITRYKTILERIFVDSDLKITIFPGRFYGLAGIGDFLLDLHQFMNEDKSYLEGACRIAKNLSLFAKEKEAGRAFVGDGLSRVSCDFATGSAGIALFLNRLTRQRVGGDFMLDEVFPTDTLASQAGDVASAYRQAS